LSEDQLVSWRLSQIEKRLDGMEVKIDSVSDEVTGWRGKASAWGTIAGAIMAIFTTIAAKVLTGK